MRVVTCEAVTFYKAEPYSYDIKYENGMVRTFFKQELKEYITSGELKVTNLVLTKTGALREVRSSGKILHKEVGVNTDEGYMPDIERILGELKVKYRKGSDNTIYITCGVNLVLIRNYDKGVFADIGLRESLDKKCTMVHMYVDPVSKNNLEMVIKSILKAIN
jgi:hypothetical protein